MRVRVVRTQGRGIAAAASGGLAGQPYQPAILKYQAARRRWPQRVFGHLLDIYWTLIGQTPVCLCSVLPASEVPVTCVEER